MADATIIVGKLDDKQLTTSIEALVKLVDKNTKAMVNSFSTAIDDINKKLATIGNGVSKATGDASSKRASDLQKEKQKVADLTMTYDQMSQAVRKITAEHSAVKMGLTESDLQSYIVLLRRLQAEFIKVNTQEGGGLKTDKMRAEIDALNQIINKYTAAMNALKQVNSRQGTYDSKKWIQDLGALDARYKQLVNWYSQLEKEDQKRIDSQRKATQAAIAEIEKYNAAQEKMVKSAQAATAAMGIPSAKTSMYNFLDAYTQKAAALRQELANMPTTTWKRATDEFKRWQVEIDATKEKVQQLKERLANTTNPNAKRGVASLLEAEQNRLNALYQKQAQAIDEVVKATQREAAEKKRTYDETRQQISDIIGKQKEFRAVARESTDEIKRQAQAIRESAQFREYGYAYVKKASGMDAIVRSEENQRAIGVKNVISLEEQLLNIKRENTKEIERQAAQEKKKIEEERAEQQAAQQVLDTQKQITAEYAKRKKYTTPDLGMPFRSMVSNKLMIDPQQLAGLGGTIQKTTTYVKQLHTAYEKLTAAERNTAFGRQLREELQLAERQLSKLRSEASRPINLSSALALPAKTLDDIAYKIQQLNAYKRGLVITDPRQRDEMDKVDKAINRLTKDLNKYMATTGRVGTANNALMRSFNYMKNRLAFYFTVGASTQFIKNLIEVRSQYEMNERALGILINSAERGTQIFNELSQMALVSPYTLIELSAAAKQLTAYDIAARDVVDTTRRLADMASAVGIPIERLTYALGQVKAYGYLNARDARMFANAGIPLVKQLSDYYTELEGRMVSTADVYDRIKKKAIDYNTVMSVITKMTDEGGKFFDFQAKMADTLKVRLANLTLAWNNMLNDIGKESQGVLTHTIDGLKQLFLHWRDLDKLIKEAAAGYGIAVALMLWNTAITRVYGSSGRLLKMFTMNAVFGRRLANVIRGIGESMKTLVSTPMTWFMVAALWALELTNAISNANEATIEFNKSLRESAKTTADELSKFLNTDTNLSLQNDLKNGDINTEEAKKAWETIREQIELSTRNSEEYVQSLLSIENVSERLRQGFATLESINTVNAALKDIDDKTIKITQDWSKWWNLWVLPDGLVENLNDYQDAVKKINEEWGDLGKAKGQEAAAEDVSKYSEALNTLRADVKATTDSIDELIERLGWSGDVDKINEVYAKVTGDLIEKNQLSPDKAFALQLLVEESRAKAAKQALLIRISDEKAALEKAADENARMEIQKRLDALRQENTDFDKNNGVGRVLWSEYTKWMKERHISEMREMFRDMDAQEISKIDFSKGRWNKFAVETANKFAREHNLSTNEVFTLLENWVKNANKWSIFIPLVISSEGGKSVYQTLEEADNEVSKADKTIERLTKRIDTLSKKQNRSAEEEKELAKAIKERQQAESDRQAALEKGGLNENKDKKDAAEEKKRAAAAERERKKREREEARQRREEESELQKALKNELAIIDKVRNVYKELTSSGAKHADAVQRATSGYDKSVKEIDSVLKKWGIAAFDLTKYAGISDPNELVSLLTSQLNTILASGRAKPSEIKDFEVKIQDLNVDAEKYNLTKITKGLNSALDKIKEEYELAVQLDADPELSDVFTNMFGIDTSGFPDTIDKYMEAVQKEFDETIKELNLGQGLNIFKATQKEWYAWGNAVGYTEKQVDDFKKEFDSSIDVVHKWAESTIGEIKELEYKFADTNEKIAIENKKLATLEEQLAKETNEIQRKYLELRIQDEKEAIARLQDELFQLLPTYEALFGGIAEHSAKMTRKLARQLRDMLEKAKPIGNDKFVVTDPRGGTATIDKKQRGKYLDKVNKELLKSQTVISKIREAFTKGKDKEADFTKGIEYLSEELKKLADLVNTIGDIATALGMSEEGQELIGDFATTLEGLGQAAEGYVKIQNGDIIGGTADMISGTWKAVSTWFDNSDKKITREIEKSKKAVRELEIAYAELEYQVEHTMGAAELGARKAAIENKRLELAELERQLALEKSRKGKKRDEEAVMELQERVDSAKRDLNDLVNEIATTLLGSDIKGAAESFVSTWVSAWRQGEDVMEALDNSFSSMIDNMIMKSIASQLVAKRLQPIWDMVNEITDANSEGGTEVTLNELKRIQSLIGDKSIAEGINEDLTRLYEALGITYGSGNATKNLSALQQGIQGITEETAGALEAYMNGVSQQVYLHSDLLIQIRDAVIGIDYDVQTAAMSQILLQLQNSYQVQMSIQNMINGALTPSGRAFSVELIN